MANGNGFLQLITQADHPTYELGDILSAVPYVHVRKMEADRHCFARDGQRRIKRLNRQGFLDTTDVLADYGVACCELQVERLSAKEAKLVRLSDMAEIRFESNKTFAQFDGKMVQMDIERYFARAISTWLKPNAQGRPLFGTDPNKLCYYCGTERYNTPEIDQVWTAVTNKMQEPEPLDMVAPFSDYRKYLAIAVTDFDHQEAARLTEPLNGPEVNGEPGPMVKKRACWVNHRESLGLTGPEIDEVEDKRKHVDRRRSPRVKRSRAVKMKTL